MSTGPSLGATWRGGADEWGGVAFGAGYRGSEVAGLLKVDF